MNVTREAFVMSGFIVVIDYQGWPTLLYIPSILDDIQKSWIDNSATDFACDKQMEHFEPGVYSAKLVVDLFEDEETGEIDDADYRFEDLQLLYQYNPA